MITTADAARKLGISRVRVHQLITSGRLRAEKFGSAYAIVPADLAAVRVRKPGRPKKRRE